MNLKDPSDANFFFDADDLITSIVFYEKYGLIGAGTVIHRNFHGKSIESLENDFPFIKFSPISSIESLQNGTFSINPFEGGHVPISALKPMLTGEGIRNWNYRRINNYQPIQSKDFWVKLASLQFYYIGHINIENELLLQTHQKFQNKLDKIDVDVYAWHWHDIGTEIHTRLRHGHKYRSKRVELAVRRIPFEIFERDILKNNGKYYGNEKLSIIEYKTDKWTTDHAKGSLPYSFMTFLTNVGNNFITKNKNLVTYDPHQFFLDYTKRHGITKFSYYEKWKNPGSTHWQTVSNAKKSHTKKKTFK